MKEVDPDWEPDKAFYYQLGSSIKTYFNTFVKSFGDLALADLKLKYLENGLNGTIKPKKQEIKTGCEKVENPSPSYKWIIGISNSEADGVRLFHYEGTVEQIKSQLVSLIREDRENDKSGWDYGSENENEISDESNGDKKVFSGFGSYSEYHIDYTAEMLTGIEKLNDD